MEQVVKQMRAVGRPTLGERFFAPGHGEDEPGRDFLNLKLAIPLVFPSDCFSLDESRDVGLKVPRGKP